MKKNSNARKVSEKMQKSGTRWAAGKFGFIFLRFPEDTGVCIFVRQSKGKISSTFIMNENRYS